MATTTFDREHWARYYAEHHHDVDPSVSHVYFLPDNAPEREIRLVEVNDTLPELSDEFLEPIIFGVDRDSDNAHKLAILDVSAGQWEKIRSRQLALPVGWSLDRALDLLDPHLT